MIIAIDGPNRAENLDIGRLASARFEPSAMTFNTVNWKRRNAMRAAVRSKKIHFIVNDTWMTDESLTLEEKLWWYERLIVGRGETFMVTPYAGGMSNLATALGVKIDPTVSEVVLSAITGNFNRHFPSYIGNPNASEKRTLHYPSFDHLWDESTIGFMDSLSTPRLVKGYGFTYA